MTETSRIELAIAAIESWKERLKSLADHLARGPLLRVTDRESDREKCLAKIETLERVLAILANYGKGGGKNSQKSK